LLLFLGFIGPGIQRVGPVHSYSPAQYASAHTIRFASGLILDTRLEPVTNNIVLEPETYWLINLKGPVEQPWLCQLRRVGIEPVGYIAYQTIVCRPEQTMLAQCITSLPFVEWLGPFIPAFKLAPELLSASGNIGLVLGVWPGENTQPVANAIIAAGGQLIRTGLRTIRFILNADSIAQIAHLESVSWIQMPDPPEPYNSEIQWVMQIGWHPQIPTQSAGQRIWTKGIRGQQMIVGLFDSGINTGHDQFCDPEFPLCQPGVFPEHRKIAAYKLYRNAAFGEPASYHGSGVAATLAGNDSVCGNYSKADGIAPDARIYFVDIATAGGTYVFDDDLTDLLDSVRLGPGLGEPVRQVSGSFGSSRHLGYYRLMEATVDAVAWQDKNFLIVWAASNNGGTHYRLGHPAGAKNAITVGATENGTQSNQMADFSSRGPTRDDRIKPNIVAPGNAITTVDGPGNSFYSQRNGTSFSAPAVSGALILLRQYFRDGWFPSGTPDTSSSIPLLSAALMRAFAIVGADSNIGTAPIPNSAVGWGRFDLSSILHFIDDSVKMTFVEETVGVATGQYHEYHIEVLNRKPVRIVLAWTDTAAAPEAEIALVNDLNLEVISPDMNCYRGNQFLNGQSRSNPPDWDTRNVEEICQFNMPLPGIWTIKVRGRNIYTQTQPYAFVVKGNIVQVPGIAGNPYARFGKSRLVSFNLPLRIKLGAGTRLTIFTSDGRCMKSFCLSRDETVVWNGTDTQGKSVPSGVYFCRLELPNQKSELEKLVLIH